MYLGRGVSILRYSERGGFNHRQNETGARCVFALVYRRGESLGGAKRDTTTREEKRGHRRWQLAVGKEQGILNLMGKGRIVLEAVASVSYSAPC